MNPQKSRIVYMVLTFVLLLQVISPVFVNAEGTDEIIVPKDVEDPVDSSFVPLPQEPQEMTQHRTQYSKNIQQTSSVSLRNMSYPLTEIGTKKYFPIKVGIPMRIMNMCWKGGSRQILKTLQRIKLGN